MTKQIIIVIIIGILIGILIFMFVNKTSSPQQTTFLNQPFPKLEAVSTPTPLPTPTPPTITESSNLEVELNNLTPRDFTTDFQNLRNSF